MNKDMADQARRAAAKIQEAAELIAVYGTLEDQGKLVREVALFGLKLRNEADGLPPDEVDQHYGWPQR